MHRVLWDRGPVLIHTIAIDSTTLNDSRSHKELREYFYYMTAKSAVGKFQTFSHVARGGEASK